MEKERMNYDEIPPFRMNLMMKVASDVTNTIVNSRHLYNPSYRECEIILELVGTAIRESKQKQ